LFAIWFDNFLEIGLDIFWELFANWFDNGLGMICDLFGYFLGIGLIMV
jgi:hypothetical protein